MSNGTYKTAIITGGSRGLGRNTAVNLARRGVDVIFTYHSNAAEAQSLVREAEAMGRKAAAFQLDTGNIKLFDGFVNDVRGTLRSWGRERFDSLVNNAGTSSVTFTIIVTPQSIMDDVRQFFQSGAIRHFGLADELLDMLDEAAEDQARGRCSHAARRYREFIDEVQEQRSKDLDPAAAAILIADAQYLIAHCP